MFFIVLGSIAFLLFFLYDLNSVGKKYAFVHHFFTIGCILLGISTLGLIAVSAKLGNLITLVGCVSGILSLIFGVILIYTLFFALPFEVTYLQTNSEIRKTYDKGVYALCRHPGVIWLFAFYLFLGISLDSITICIQAFILSLLNILYVVMQDIYIFPKIFTDYDNYKINTPFLIPNICSLKKCLSFYK